MGSLTVSIHAQQSDTIPAAVTTLDVGAIVSAGGPATMYDGTVVSIPAPTGPQNLQSPFSAAGYTFIPLPASIEFRIEVGSQIISAGGGAATLSGMVFSLGSNGLIIGSSTMPLSAVMTAADTGSGGQAVTAGESGSGVSSGARSRSSVGSGGSGGNMVSASSEASGPSGYSSGLESSTGTSVTGANGGKSTSGAQTGTATRLIRDDYCGWRVALALLMLGTIILSWS